MSQTTVVQINVAKFRDFPFVIKDHAGVVDTTNDFTPTVDANGTNTISVSVLPDKRTMRVIGIANTPGGSTANVAQNAHITIAAYGKNDVQAIFVPVPPDLASVFVQNPGVEQDVP